MEFVWNEMQTMLKDSARKFCENEFPPSTVKDTISGASAYDPEIWKKMAELGWLGFLFGEQYGGSDGTFLDMMPILEEMGRVMAPSPFFSSIIMGGLILSEGADDRLKELYLKKLCQGELIVTPAVLEEEGSWMPSTFLTKATKMDKNYLLQGRKLFVADAEDADAVLVVAQSGEDENKSSIFVADPKSPNVTLNPLKTISGEKMYEMVFDGVEIPADHLVGEEGKGRDIILNVWPRMVVGLCGKMVGGMEKVLEMTVQYAKERHQFGVPIGTFQVIQHYCVDMLTLLETSRILTYQAADRASGEGPCLKHAAMAKASCSDAFIRIVNISHQVHGAIGFTEEHNLHIYSRHAKAWELMLGSAGDHRQAVAGAVLDE